MTTLEELQVREQRVWGQSIGHRRLCLSRTLVGAKVSSRSRRRNQEECKVILILAARKGVSGGLWSFSVVT